MEKIKQDMLKVLYTIRLIRLIKVSGQLVRLIILMSSLMLSSPVGINWRTPPDVPE